MGIKEGDVRDGTLLVTEFALSTRARAPPANSVRWRPREGRGTFAVPLGASTTPSSAGRGIRTAEDDDAALQLARAKQLLSRVTVYYRARRATARDLNTK